MSAISKRQQARNERTLQELIKNVPGNNQCADCGAKNPGWASWSLGIFLCMRCAALHRKVGTHITKVKSLSMDTWNSEQVDNMKRIGNVNSNRLYNPQNVKPAIPVDVDEVEGVMERYIRQKYEQRAFSAGNTNKGTRQHTGSTSTGSIEDQPPPLPPKPGKKFGFSFRSSSSTFPAQQRMDKYTPPISPAFSGSDGRQSPTKGNKASRMFGTAVGGHDDDFDSKLARLREMGFSDARRNSMVLKNMNGNLDRTVEALVRLGEPNRAPSRTLTPVSVGSATANGLTVEKRRAPEPAKAAVSTNPFDALDHERVPPLPQRAATQPLPPPPSTFAASQPVSYNPFFADSAQYQQTQALQNGFQNMQISGAAPQQFAQPTQNQATQQYAPNPFFNNPVPQQQQQQLQHAQVQAQEYPQYNQQPLVQDTTQSNPFLRRAQSQTFAPSNPFLQSQPQQQAAPAQNPWQQNQLFQQPPSQSPAPLYQQSSDFFSTQPQQPQQPQQQQLPQQQQQQQQQPFYDQSQQNYILSNNSNPFQQPQQTPQPQPFQPQLPQHTQPPVPQFSQHQQAPQPFQRHDKSSILALYNYPQLAPSRPGPLQSLPEDAAVSPQRSATMPAPGSSNPFAAGMGMGANGVANGVGVGARHVSQESVDFTGLGSGRHSPDAFSGLSARFVR